MTLVAIEHATATAVTICPANHKDEVEGQDQWRDWPSTKASPARHHFVSMSPIICHLEERFHEGCLH